MSFEKCSKINEMTEGLKANEAYFFFRRIDSPQDSEVICERETGHHGRLE